MKESLNLSIFTKLAKFFADLRMRYAICISNVAADLRPSSFKLDIIIHILILDIKEDSILVK